MHRLAMLRKIWDIVYRMLLSDSALSDSILGYPYRERKKAELMRTM